MNRFNKLKELINTNLRLFIVIIFLLFVLFLFIFFIQNSMKSNNNLITFEECSNLSGGDLNSCVLINENCFNDSCLFNKSIITQNESMCNKINNSLLRIRCNAVVTHNRIFMDSVIYNNISLCDNLLDKSSIISCRDNYYYVMAYNYGNYSLCDLISKEEFRNECRNQ